MKMQDSKLGNLNPDCQGFRYNGRMIVKHDLTPRCSLVREIPYFREIMGNLGLEIF